MIMRNIQFKAEIAHFKNLEKQRRACRENAKNQPPLQYKNLKVVRKIVANVRPVLMAIS